MREVFFQPGSFDEDAFRYAVLLFLGIIRCGAQLFAVWLVRSGHVYGFGQTLTNGFGTGVGGASQNASLYQPVMQNTPSFAPSIGNNINPFSRMGIPITSGGS